MTKEQELQHFLGKLRIKINAEFLLIIARQYCADHNLKLATNNYVTFTSDDFYVHYMHIEPEPKSSPYDFYIAAIDHKPCHFDFSLDE